MDWIQFSLFFAGIVVLFFGNRSKSRTDNRRALDLVEAINKEMKDFHDRLCTIEERYRGK